MALGTIQKINAPAVGLLPVSLGAAKGVWSTAITSVASGRALSGANLLNPAGASDTYHQPIRIGPHSKHIQVRGKYTTSGPTAGDDCGVVRVYAYYTGGDDVTDLAGYPCVRLDNSVAGSAGITVTADLTNDTRNGTHSFTQPIIVGGSQMIDVRGADYVVVGLETASDLGTSVPTLNQIEVCQF